MQKYIADTLARYESLTPYTKEAIHNANDEASIDDLIYLDELLPLRDTSTAEMLPQSYVTLSQHIKRSKNLDSVQYEFKKFYDVFLHNVRMTIYFVAFAMSITFVFADSAYMFELVAVIFVALLCFLSTTYANAVEMTADPKMD